MRTLIIFAPLVVLGSALHVLLFGFGRAPVDSVRLSRRQWAFVATTAVPVVSVFIGLWAFSSLRAWVTSHLGEDAVEVLFLSSVSGMVGITIGLAPAKAHESAD